MKVKGVEITDSQIAAMHNVIGERFRASDVIAAAEKAGVSSGEVAMRAADRILQKLRKDKKIQIIGSGPYWKRGIDVSSVKIADQQNDHSAWLKAQLEQAIKAQSAAARSAERANKKLGTANAVVDALKGELGMCLIASWRESPDLSILLSADDGYGMPMYQAFLAWAEQTGFDVPGGYYADTQQRVIGIGVDAAEEGSVARVMGLINQVLPSLKYHTDGRRWLHVQQVEYTNCSIELRIDEVGQTNVVRIHYGMIEEEHPFDTVRSALMYLREHFPCATTFEGSGTELLEHARPEAEDSQSLRPL